MKRFVIVSQARCGSTMLGTALGQHRQVLMHGEIFGDYHFPLNFYGVDEDLPWPTPLEIVLKKLRDRDPVGFLGDYVFADTARTAVGFKFKFDEFPVWPVVRQFLIEQRVPILRIARKNLFDRFISEKIALTSGLFNTSDKVNHGAAARHGLVESFAVEHIIAAIEGGLAHLVAFDDAFAFNPVLRLDYDDLVLNWFATFHLVCDFLGIERLNFSPMSAKRGFEDRLDRLLDLKALRREVAARGFAEHV
jgi:hypothetical protein